MSCTKYKTDLEDLLLEGDSFAATAAGERALAHVETCAECRHELESLRATMQMLDAWAAPELSPYFDTRLAVRLREEASAAPAGFWERVTQRWHLGTHSILKPAMAAVAAIAVVIGGATYAGVSFWNQPNSPIEASATVRDLQSFDRNQQALEALQALDQDSDSGDGSQVSQ